MGSWGWAPARLWWEHSCSPWTQSTGLPPETVVPDGAEHAIPATGSGTGRRGIRRSPGVSVLPSPPFLPALSQFPRLWALDSSSLKEEGSTPSVALWFLV